MIFLIFSVTSFSIYFSGKRTPKWIQNTTKNHPDANFFRFWGVLGGGVFSTFFVTGKSRPQIGKNPTLPAQRGHGTCKMGRPGGMRGATGEVRRGLEPLRVRQDPGQESKT